MGRGQRQGAEGQRGEDGVVGAPAVALRQPPDRAEGTSVTGPHMSETVEPLWSRSGSIAIPPTAAIQAT
jgi:hypothetical protein